MWHPEVDTTERRTPYFLNQNSEIAFRSGAALKHPDRTGRGEMHLHPFPLCQQWVIVKQAPGHFYRLLILKGYEKPHPASGLLSSKARVAEVERPTPQSSGNVLKTLPFPAQGPLLAL